MVCVPVGEDNALDALNWDLESLDVSDDGTGVGACIEKSQMRL